ncbi:unnamed protein product [Nippostrongylus brasiliensis]|uniref:Saposin B-type domain-containing protein n=1 Tax=Nippostrongylus brasiliensis TaxID=27835 RepID=A0A0N4YZH0_NIPBR|nr:unnamed protein product [Nippostrongylus brasiliensis]
MWSVLLVTLLAGASAAPAVEVQPECAACQLFSIALTKTQSKEPFAEVLAGGQPSPTLCTMCFLVYYFFQFMNNGILQLPLLNLIPQVIQLTCIIITNANNEITPPVCQALVADGAMPALLKAIADSMGSFYDLIAVQSMGCPTYQTLFGTC